LTHRRKPRPGVEVRGSSRMIFSSEEPFDEVLEALIGFAADIFSVS